MDKYRPDSVAKFPRPINEPVPALDRFTTYEGQHGPYAIGSGRLRPLRLSLRPKENQGETLGQSIEEVVVKTEDK